MQAITSDNLTRDTFLRQEQRRKQEIVRERERVKEKTCQNNATVEIENKLSHWKDTRLKTQEKNIIF